MGQLNAGGFENFNRCFPRPMDPVAGQAGELRHPAPDIAPLGVEFLALLDRVKDAEVRGGIGAAAGGPLPTQRVVREVGIDQRIPEPRGAILPGNQQVLDQKRRRNHSYAVMHPAGVP